MKIKIFAMCVMICLIFTGINVVANQSQAEETLILKLSDNISFSEPSFEENSDFTFVTIEETDDYILIAEAPKLPVYIKTYTFPIGTIIKNVDLQVHDVKEQIILKTIEPCSKPLPLLNIKKSEEISENEIINNLNIYSSSELYPETWFSYRLGCGLDGLERVIFLTIYCFPVRYSPLENTIFYINNLDIEIEYSTEESIFPLQDNYDLVIISPSVFVDNLQTLVDHKNSFGVRTIVKTVDEIYSSYPGRDKPEQIKYYIKDAIETYNIKYVLLVGARVGFTGDWYLPPRYSNLEDRGGWNETYVSDLYFSDIYKVDDQTHEVIFDDWDSNANDVFAEWTWLWNPEWGWWSNDVDQFDELDLYPDVYVGRLACIDVSEVYTVVNKIIKYEKTTYGKSWFNKMIVVGGDTVPFYLDEYYEGEIETALGASYMEPLGFEINKLWTSTGALKSSADFISAVREGSGFLYLSGHGSPIVWSTHPPQDESWIDFYNFQACQLLNLNKLPVCVVGGCHNSQFDSGIINFKEGIKKLSLKYFTYIEDENCFAKNAWVPSCWSWNLVKRGFGGTIASIGNTGLGWGSPGLECTEELDGWIGSHFFESYSNLYNDENCTLGMVHSQTLSNYITNFDPNYKYNILDRKTVEQWTLLGDPSLKIGGFSS